MSYDGANKYPASGSGGGTTGSRSVSDELLSKLLGFSETSLNHPMWRSFLVNAKTDFAYAEDDPWTKAELDELEARGQSPAKENIIYPKIQRLIGQQRKQKTRISYKGRNDPTDAPTGEILSDLAKYVQQDCGYEHEEADMFDNGVTCGFSCLWSDVSFDDEGSPHINWSYQDELNIFYDPFSKRYDWNKDAAYVGRWKWVKAEEAKALYPGKKDIIDSALNDQYNAPVTEAFKLENYVDKTYKRVRLFEVWYKEKTSRKMAFPVDGKAVDISDYKDREVRKLEKDPGVNVYSEPLTKIRMSVFCVGGVLEDKESPYDHKLYPAVPFFVKRRKTGEPYSFPRLLISLQSLINKKHSKALHLLVNTQTISEEGAITDMDEFKAQKARPDGDMRYRKGYKLEMVKNIDLAASHMQLLQEHKLAGMEIAGFNSNERQEIRSNQQLQRNQSVQDLPAVTIFENLRRTRGMIGLLTFFYMRQFFKAGMIFNITDNQQIAQQRMLTEEHITAIKESDFDVIVDEMPDTTTIKQEHFGMFMDFVQQAHLPPQRLDMFMPDIIRSSELPNKEGIAKKWEAAGAPPPDRPKISVAINYDTLSPQERLALAQEMQNPAWVQAIQQAPPTPTHIVKAQEGIQKTQIKAQADIQAAQIGKPNPQVEIAMKQQEIKLKGQEHQQKMAMQAQDHQMKMQHKVAELHMKAAAGQQNLALKRSGVNVQANRRPLSSFGGQ